MTRPTTLTLIALALAGCGDGTSSSDAIVRDSAGIRIVENPAPGERVAFAVEPEPVVSIGMLEGPDEYTFRGVRAAARLDDGRIVVADGTELKFYDAAGRHLVTAGGEGEGPGEFTFLNGLVVCGAEVVAGDMRQQHLTVFDEDGAFRRTIALPKSGNQFFSMSLEACDAATGLPLLRPPTTFSPGDAGTVEPSAMPILRLDTATAGADTIAEVPTRPRPRGMSGPFEPAMRYAYAASRVHLLDTEAIAVHTYGPEGALRQIARVAHEPRPVTEADHRRAIDSLVARMPPAFSEQMRPQLERTTPPAHMPAVNTMTADAAGRVWIRPFAAAWDPPANRWLVLDADGTLLGTVALPDRFNPLDIGEDWVLGVWQDELDVSYVRLYRFGVR